MFLAVSRRVHTAVGFGVAVLVVQSITVPLNHLIHRYLLRPGALAWAGLPDLDLSYLGLITYVGVIAALVQVLEMLLDRFFPVLFGALGIFLPLLTVNCAILGGSLFMVQREYTFAQSVVYGVGSGAGWLLAIALLAGIREKLRYADPPAGLRGLGLSFVVVGLISLAFLAFAGIRL
jgi:Na+-transporting NADH:ubiquinone oxidoreductase subunit E